MFEKFSCKKLVEITSGNPLQNFIGHFKILPGQSIIDSSISRIIRSRRKVQLFAYWKK